MLQLGGSYYRVFFEVIQLEVKMKTSRELYVASQLAYTDEELARFIKNKIEPKMLKKAKRGEYSISYAFRPFFPEGKVDAIRDMLEKQGFYVYKPSEGLLVIDWILEKYKGGRPTPPPPKGK
jgi:hypothetical protein